MLSEELMEHCLFTTENSYTSIISSPIQILWTYGWTKLKAPQNQKSAELLAGLIRILKKYAEKNNGQADKHTSCYFIIRIIYPTL